ncbi:MAG: carboxypeptidase regulatory-like domain-containing protein [Pirellulaceae bacterium]|nr:carboxypeptidase regulatory-like domain-containing protein [Pirellulaceae bacterium]
MQISRTFRRILGWADSTASAPDRAPLRTTGSQALASSGSAAARPPRQRRNRRAVLEQLEPRQLMAADIRIGAVYTEFDSGSDLEPDKFIITFDGGAPNTQLTRVVFDADLYDRGLSRGDLIFDTAPGGLGADRSHPFKVVQLHTKNPTATVKATVEDGSSLLILEFTNFTAGDKLIFSIDVDEVVHMLPGETDIAEINEGVDPIASGIEFQGTRFTAEFKAPHYEDASGVEKFLNAYDRLLDPLQLPLPRDDDNGLHDRTTGVGLVLKQQPKPISLAGTVWVDTNEDLKIGANEQRLANVSVELFVLQNGVYVTTGHTTQTDSQGRYSFSSSLGLRPATYQVRQTQPAGYYSVGATTGKLTSGGSIGQLVSGNPDMLTHIELVLGDTHAIELNFAENLPASLSGRVCYVVSGMDCLSEDAVRAPQAQVLIELLDSSGKVVASTRTAADGTYQFSNLRAGTYTVRQTNQAGFIDGVAKPGSAGGTVADPNTITQIIIGGGGLLTDYNFCDLQPAQVSGHVYFDANNNGQRDNGELPLGNVLIQLWDSSGKVVGTTRTNSAGFYSFNNLRPGIYRITEQTPADYHPGRASAGSLGGTTDATGDVIAEIRLGSGAQGINYDFGELLLGSIQGRVIADTNGNCIIDAQGDMPLPGVRIELLDRNGTIITYVLTDAQGYYRFDNLTPDTYTVREIQPAGYFQGGQRAGSGGGDASIADLISQIIVQPGARLVDYNFCEVPPAQISGQVFFDRNQDCVRNEDEPPIAGVVLTLLDPSGNVIGTTTTDAQGQYQFTNLRAGNYTIRQTQPAGYLQGGQKAGSGGGIDAVQDEISAIIIGAGANLVHYDFCELLPARLSGYVYQDGPTIKTVFGQFPANIQGTHDGRRTDDDRPIAGVVLRLLDRHGQPVSSNLALPGTYSGPFIEAKTDHNGYYEFAGLPPGIYHVLQTQPEDYLDWIDSPGTTGGRVLPNQADIDQFLDSLAPAHPLRQLGAAQLRDAIFAIELQVGEHSMENNFSEVQTEPIFPPPPPLPPPPLLERPLVDRELFPGLQPILWQPLRWAPLPLIVGGGHLPEMTWHLSVVNGGFPRGMRNGDPISPETVQDQANLLDVQSWTVRGMRSSQYRFTSLTPNTPDSESPAAFYLQGATPLMGDFNGDGFDELALFLDGEWFIDINGNGRWDEEDIWLKLGTKGDQPVVGDWDGDGKDDIGIFGHKWTGDDRALAVEPGMPDPQNFVRTQRPKNIPRGPDETPDSPRLMQPRRDGQGRADVIDHVFRFGSARDIAVSGDFNGDGVSTIGTFRDGQWNLDTNGDGKLNERSFLGQPGDLPLVGDFDGDGIDELAVVRGNRVLVDSNRNGRFDATDRVFELDSTDGTVIVGDFSGDGCDEPALYQSPDQRRLQARRQAG